MVATRTGAGDSGDTTTEDSMQSTSQHTESTFAGWPAQTTGQTDSSTTQPPASTSETGATQPPAFTSEPARPTTLQPSALTVNLPAPPSTSSHATTATSNMANLPAPAVSYTGNLSQLTSIATLLPFFRGKLHEDPITFMRQCTELLQGHHIPSYTWVMLLKAQLQDDAAAWWRDYGEFVTTWEQFRDRLQARFSGAHKIAAAHTEFYGTTHKPNQPVERFIRQKLQLQQRLGTNLAEDEVIALLIGQLSSELRTLVRAARPTNYEELIMIANDLETDLNSRPKYKPPQPTAPAGPPHREPPPRFNYNQLPQCHYCPAKHFHRDCPELAKKRQGNGDTGETRTPPLQHGK